jgi:hypothetical protein
MLEMSNQSSLVFVLYAFVAYGISRRVYPVIMKDAPVGPDVLLVTPLAIGLICAIACYFAVSPDRPRRPRR